MSGSASAQQPVPQFYKVPAGTRSSRCSGPTCGKQIYFITNPRSGRMMPVDCGVEGGEPPTATKDKGQSDLFAGEIMVHDGRGVSHFLTCPDAEQFSRGRGGR